ncbi:MAG: RlmE family RNA methyltransferase [Candidatus Thermoplasmatota archaeon]|nr:RlmE family RNA methyltransferase [Candidatus Thermoplasmatota archaeon]
MGYKRKDEYYHKAKEEGYRSRAVYKLKQIDEKFDVFYQGNVVVDLGAAPGSWSEYAVEKAGKENVLAVDKERMRDIEGVTFHRGDMTDENFVKRISIIAGDVDVVISDMSPNLTGNYSMDHARSIHLAKMALNFCLMNMKKRGRFVVKVFQGEDFEDYMDKVKQVFSSVYGHSPNASRESSSEMYIIGKGFTG